MRKFEVIEKGKLLDFLAGQMIEDRANEPIGFFPRPFSSGFAARQVFTIFFDRFDNGDTWALRAGERGDRRFLAI